jgi:hypothetical protein
VRRFDDNRKDIFHYALFAHFLGLPKNACQDSTTAANAVCQQYPSDFHVPVTNSGIGDFPGGDLIVSLGAFDNSENPALPVGTDFMQGSTLMHELGHNFELTHAGAPQIPRAPNCDPIYLSVMNYMYQLRGLLDDNSHGHMDYNHQLINGFNENALSDGALGNNANKLPYKLGWYAPKFTSYLRSFVGGEATKHCDGSAITDAEKPALAAVGGMVRVDGIKTDISAIDWNADGLQNSAGPKPTFPGVQDINFSGFATPLNAATDDWTNVHLNQLGGRRNVGGLYINKTTKKEAVGPLSLDVGHGDIGHGDIGHGDIGHGDIGHGDIGHGDIGHGDIGMVTSATATSAMATSGALSGAWRSERQRGERGPRVGPETAKAVEVTVPPAERTGGLSDDRRRVRHGAETGRFCQPRRNCIWRPLCATCLPLRFAGRPYRADDAADRSDRSVDPR